MKAYKIFLFFILLVPICMQIRAQGLKSKFFASCEVMSLGPEFTTGSPRATLKPGMQIGLFPTHVSSYKLPNLYIGAGLYFGQHKFNPTPQEKAIIDTYEIVTTTTSKIGTTTSSEPLEEITVTRLGIGLPMGFQTLGIDKKTSYFIGIIPTYHKLSNGLKGDEHKRMVKGFGAAIQTGMNYKFDGGMTIRVSYIHGSLPDFSLFTLDGRQTKNRRRL